MRFYLLLSLLCFPVLLCAQSFEAEQLEYKRVQKAKDQKLGALAGEFSRKGLSFAKTEEIFFRVFKQEARLEAWVRQKGQSTFVKLKDYPVCALSGNLGPKRKQYDKQIPEGFYVIDRFNPLSGYHLSMRVSYPNQSDIILGVRGSLGGDIYIHGGCKTVGCLPMTNDEIQNLYLLCMYARDRGQENIPIHIFPYDFSQGQPDYVVNQLVEEKKAATLALWDNFKEGFQFFEDQKKLPFVFVEEDGYYSFY